MATVQDTDPRWARLVDEHREQQARLQLLPEPRPLPTTGRRLLCTYGAALLATPGGFLVWLAMRHLRWAYLYREASEEGIGFAWVALSGGVGACLVGTATWLLFDGSRGLARRPRWALRAVGLAMSSAVLACWAVAAWVNAQSGCIGPCG